MKKILKSFDQFGVLLTPSVKKEEPIYRSVAGGLISILIYAASLTYAIYVIFLWLNGQFSPKVSTIPKPQNFTGETFNLSFIRLGFWKYNDTLVDPFKAQGNILTPLIQTQYTNGEIKQTYNILNNNVEDVTDYGGQRINPNLTMSFIADPKTWEATVGFIDYILLVKCEPKYMKSGQYCASQDEIDNFFKQPLNSVVVYLEYTNLHPLTQELMHRTDYQYYQIDEFVCNTNFLQFQTTEYEIKNSFLPGQSQFQTHVSGSSIQGQVSSLQYCQKGFNVDALNVIYFYLDFQQTKALLEYPNIGDILANIGSIISVIFMARHVIVAFNSYFLQRAIIRQLYEYYYPEFHKIIVKTNWLKRIQSVSLNGKSIDIEAYKEFEQNLRGKMLGKISLTNMIYELSRLEFIVRSIISSDNIKKCHGVGIKVRLKELQQADAEIDLEPSLSDQKPFTMVDEDCNALSLDHRYYYQTNRINDEIQHANFYDVNQIIV